MKKLFTILALVFLANCSGIFKSKPEFLFVQTAKNASFDGKTLRLDNISKNLINFSDRPFRIARHTTTQRYAEIWNNGRDSFRKDPPNATISYHNSNGTPSVAVVEISDLKIKGNSAFYDIKILEGKLNNKFNEVALFIDGSSCCGGWNDFCCH